MARYRRPRADLDSSELTPADVRLSASEVARPELEPAFTGRTALALLAVGMVLLWLFGLVGLVFFV